MNHWVIRYDAPIGRASVAVCAESRIAHDVARRLPNATLVTAQSAREAETLAAVFDVPAAVNRIKEAIR